jgi:hypothetical protein
MTIYDSATPISIVDSNDEVYLAHGVGKILSRIAVGSLAPGINEIQGLIATITDHVNDEAMHGGGGAWTHLDNPISVYNQASTGWVDVSLQSAGVPVGTPVVVLCAYLTSYSGSGGNLYYRRKGSSGVGYMVSSNSAGTQTYLQGITDANSTIQICRTVASATNQVWLCAYLV